MAHLRRPPHMPLTPWSSNLKKVCTRLCNKTRRSDVIRTTNERFKSSYCYLVIYYLFWRLGDKTVTTESPSSLKVYGEWLLALNHCYFLTIWWLQNGNSDYNYCFRYSIYFESLWRITVTRMTGILSLNCEIVIVNGNLLLVTGVEVCIFEICYLNLPNRFIIFVNITLFLIFLFAIFWLSLRAA